MQKDSIMSFEKFATLCITVCAALITVAATISGLHEQAIIGNSPDPIATACALQSPRNVSSLCIIHEQQVALHSAQSLQPLQD